MAFWNRRREQRDQTSGLANPAGFITESFTGSSKSPSGQRVTVEKALSLAPVWAAVSIISEQVGQLPLKVYKKLDDGARIEATSHRSYAMLHDKPNAYTPADRFWAAVTTQLLLWGNVFIEKVRSPDLGVVDELYLLHPGCMVVEWNPVSKVKRFIYEPNDGRPKQIYSDDEVLHIFGLSMDGVIGQSVIRCKGALGAALAREEFEGAFYDRGATLTGVIKHPDKMSREAAANLKNSFDVLYGRGSKTAHGVPVFEEGSEFVPIGSPLRDLMFVESQQLSRTDIAVMFGLQPNDIGGSSGDSLTYATVEMNQEHRALTAIAPRANTIAKALSNDSGILPQGVHYAEFTLEAMMRANAKDRGDFYKVLSEVKSITANEIRQRENLPDLTAAQKAELNPPAPQPPPPTPPQLQLPVNGSGSVMPATPAQVPTNN